MLESAGVTAFEELVYRVLLRRADASLAELSREVGAGPPRVGRALAKLDSLGLVRRLDSRRYAPVSPETAIDALVHRQYAALDQLRGAAAELVEEFRLRDMHNQPGGLIEVVTGVEAVRQRSVEFQYGPRRSIMSFDKPPYATPPVGYDEVGTERPLLDRGVEMRVIYDTEALQVPGRLAKVTDLVRLGEEARTLPSLPLKLYIYDRRLALLPLTDRHIREAMAIVHRSTLLDALVALFEAYWARARPITADPGRAEDDLSTQEAAVLTMLSAGLTDQAIARQLGVSLRTARRRIAAILDRVHASTRFQAGAAAAHRGWI